jgi:circadian clock protein KaiC
MISTSVVKLTTGVPGFEVLTKGGIPAGRTILVAGRSGTGKSILSLQIACLLAHAGRHAIYVAVEERPDDLASTADMLGLDASSLLAGDKLRFLDLRRPLAGPTHVTGEYDIAGLTETLLANASAIGASLIVIDSITALFRPRPDESTIRVMLFQLVSALEDRGLTVLLTAESPHDYSRATTFGVEDYLCDLVLVLRNVVDGKRRRRSIEVQKYRRSAHYKGEYPFTITDRGVTIFPMDALREIAVSPGERFSSGVAGLDGMTSGGLLRDAIVLVRGPTGSGKTILAGMYAHAGAARGERVVYYGFEETRPMLLRNFDQLGLPLRNYDRDDGLRIVCMYPEAMSPEDLLIDLRRDLDHHRPSVIVIDSISSIEHSTSVEGFRVFMIGLAAMLRERGRSALLTQTIAARAEATHDPPFMSTIADAILQLDYTAEETELLRTIRVLKMRGSAHDASQRTLTIGQGGLSIADKPTARASRGG